MDTLEKLIPWLLSTPLDRQQQLFYEIEQTGYEVNAYRCRCGVEAFIITYPLQDLEYICLECGNEHFYDANHANLSMGHFMSSFEELERVFHYDFEIEFSKNRCDASLYIEVPISIDFVAERVRYKKHNIYTVTISSEKKIEYDYLHKYEQSKFSFIKDRLKLLINKNPEKFNIPPKDGITYNAYDANFFMSNRFFKTFDFSYWHDADRYHLKDITIEKALKLVIHNRKEKSVKRALYRKYTQQIEIKAFHHLLISVFAKHIEDPNLLVRAINMPVTQNEFSKINIETIEKLILFLKLHYSEKQIIVLFDFDIEKKSHLFIDMLNAFFYAGDGLQDEFQNVTCNITALHNEFSRCLNTIQNEEIKQMKFSYLPSQLNKCTTVLGYQVSLPLDGKELLLWADTMHNCLASYYQDIYDNLSIIYGFFQNGAIIFAVEIDIENAMILQASGMYNSILTESEEIALDIWYKKIYKQNKGDGLL